MGKVLKFHSIKNLIHAVDSFPEHASVIQNQVRRIQDRLSSGKTTSGESFRDFKDKKVYHKNSRPLQRAARLFEGARIEHSKALVGDVKFTASITGQAAIIARYQNSMRRFLGYSSSDRREVRNDFASAIIGAYRLGGSGWH